MRHLGKLVALTAVALAFVAPTAAQADPGITSHMKVDGYLGNCRFTDASTNNNPPSPLVINADTVNPPGGNLSCDDGTASPHLDNNPGVSFGPNADTATVDRLVVTGSRIGVTCTYEATNIALTRDSQTGWYHGSDITARRIGGSIFFCPPSTTGGTMGLYFH